MITPQIRQLQHPKERERATILTVFGILGWLVIALGIMLKTPAVLLLYAIDIGAFVVVAWLAAAMYRAWALGHSVLLSEQQFPHLHAMVVEGARRLGLDSTPHAFLYNSSGVLNAFARRLLGGRYIFLASSLVEATDDEQVRFVIGHEIAHHAAGHFDLGKRLLHFPGQLVPFVYPAYSRARELTCDRAGLHLARDAHTARSALQMLACGCGRLNAKMNCEAFAAQDALIPGFSGLLVKLFATHPRLTRRVLEIGDYAQRLRHPTA